MNKLDYSKVTVNSFYLAFFGRPADPEGLAFWNGHLAANGGDYRLITEAFAGSEEARIRFGGDTPAERITDIYQQLFNRAPDQVGLDYWTDVVKQGHASLADVAFVILDGARGSDLRLAQLREQAVADFSALVASSGSDYAGYAAVEAARVLVRAVGPDASQADIAQLVRAVVAFADIASTNPAVIDAMATGSTLLALFDTPRGLQSPVALAQVLASVAQAAADGPGALESLLRGSGMAGVLAALPARHSLQDLVDAFAADGLEGAIGMVYPVFPGTPGQPAQPPQSLDLAFESVEQGELDKVVDHVTNIKDADITFSIDGALRAGQHAEYKLGGGAWSTAGLQVGATTIIIEGPDLTLAAVPGGAVVTLRVVDAVRGEIASASQNIVLDLDPPGQPMLELAADSGLNANDGITNDGRVEIDGLDADTDTRWEYSLDGDDWLAGGANDGSGKATLDLSAVADGDIALIVRQVDAAGNVRQSDTLDFTHDTSAPGEGLVYQGIVGEPAGSLVTSQPRIDVVYRVTDRDDGIVQWRLKGETTWNKVEQFAGDGSFTLEDIDLTAADPVIEVRLIDAAGNVGAATLATTIHGPYSPFSVTADHEGLWIESTVAGTIRIGDSVVLTDAPGGGAIAGRVLVPVQGLPVSGKLTLTVDGGATHADPSGRDYSFGNAGDDPLDGRYLWGFDGDDTLDGTAGDDFLSGGGGFDTIYSRGGKDIIHGGTGGDHIVLVADGKGSTLLYAPGDAFTPGHQEGENIEQIDRIDGAEVGDVIELGAIFAGMPTVSNAYLTGNIADRVAIVRGDSDADGFRANPAGSAYMVQWNDINGIHSIVFNDFAGRRLGLEIDVAAGRMTLTDPLPDLPLSAYTGFDAEIGLGSTILKLYAGPDALMPSGYPDGLLTAGGLKLLDYTLRDPVTVTTAYTGRPGFGVNDDGELDLGGALKAGAYLMRWDEHTFATAGGALDKDVIMFAGGVGGMVVQEMFELTVWPSANGGVPVNRPATGNDLMYSEYSGNRIEAPGKHGVISEIGAQLTVTMSSAFSSASSDMFLGFDSNDRIEFNGAAKAAVDRQADGVITWVRGPGTVVAGAHHEAALITTTGLLASAQLGDDASATLVNLRDHLDVSALGSTDSLLILARDAGSNNAMLLYYKGQDGNGTVNAHELTLVGTFFDGAPDTLQFMLGAF